MAAFAKDFRRHQSAGVDSRFLSFDGVDALKKSSTAKSVAKTFSSTKTTKLWEESAAAKEARETAEKTIDASRKAAVERRLELLRTAEKKQKELEDLQVRDWIPTGKV